MISQMNLLQALDVWSELEDAYHGVANWGGDTAEIYISRLLPRIAGQSGYSSLQDLFTSPIFGEDAKSVYRAANRDLYDLMMHFASKKDVLVEVEGKKLGPWFLEGQEPWTHRVHVKIQEKTIHPVDTQA